jgi:Domain of unknown function (DUF4352)
LPKLSPIGKVGEAIEAGGVALTVGKGSKTADASRFAKAKPGNIYLVVDVTLESPGRDEAPYNPLYFKVKDSDNFEYNPLIVGAPEPTLKTGKLAKGEKTRGNVAFEVPAAAKGFVMSYEALVILGGYRVLRIDLGQQAPYPAVRPRWVHAARRDQEQTRNDSKSVRCDERHRATAA